MANERELPLVTGARFGRIPIGVASVSDGFGQPNQGLRVAGFTFNVLNRKLDDAGTRCGDVGGTVRQFQVHVSDGIACSELVAYGTTAVPDPTGPGCTLTYVDNPRIRLAKLYASKPSKTPVAFLIEMFDPPAGHGGFEIRTDSDATISIWSGNANLRRVSYTQTARLYKFGSTKPYVVGGAFPLPLHMTFERFPQ